MVRIEVARHVAPLPAGQFSDVGDAPAVADRAARDQGFRDRLGEAASDYFATQWGDPAFALVTERWITQDTFPETAAAAVCSRIGTGLNAIVARPLDAIGTEIRLPAPVASAGAGIGADLILQPVTRPLGQAARFCEIACVVIGLATGFHPLALAAAKMFAHDEFHRMLARGIGEAARTLVLGPQRPSPLDRPGSDREPEGRPNHPGRPRAPEPTRTPDRRLNPLRDPLPSPRRPDVPPPRGPSIRGPGSF
jgi:hypothetical protein